MARPERNNVDYFPHPVKHGRKMFVIKQKYGNQGYAIWFQLLEELGNADFHYLDFNEETQVMYLASKFLTTETELNTVLSDLARLNAINRELWQNHKVVFSEKLVSSIEDAYKNRNNKPITLQGLCGKLSIKPGKKQGKCGNTYPDNPQSKVKKSKGKNIIGKKHSFPDSPFFKKEIFKKELPDWSNQMLSYYYQAACDYSEANGGKYLNWIVAVKNWERKDRRESKGFYYKNGNDEIPV
jgi:hypothetical protein